MHQWSVRDEILAITHRWPIIVMFCLVGSLAGWGASFVWPSPYQASSEMFVGLNIYRWSEDQNVIRFTDGLVFNYPDDYKNWQMVNLNVIILTSDVQREMLRQLREQDPYWLSVSQEDLGEMLEVNWRNAGKWQLVVNHPRPQQAAQAMVAWQNTALEIVNTAINSARQTLQLDIQMQAIANQQAEMQARLAALQEALNQITGWQKEVAQLPQDQALSDDQILMLQSWTAAATRDTPAWLALNEEFPADAAPQSEYLNWSEQAVSLLQGEILFTHTGLEELEREWSQADESFARTSKRSRGVSPTLQMEMLSETVAAPTQIRPASLLALVGGILGLIVWGLFWLGWIALKNKQ